MHHRMPGTRTGVLFLDSPHGSLQGPAACGQVATTPFVS